MKCTSIFYRKENVLVISPMSNYAPIVLFVYNRPEHTRRTLEALSKNHLVQDSELFIFADGPKKSSTTKTLKNITETRQLIKNISWCKSVTYMKKLKTWV